MTYILVLSQDNLKLAKCEIESLLKISDPLELKIVDKYLIFNPLINNSLSVNTFANYKSATLSNKKIDYTSKIKKLSYTKRAFKVLFVTTPEKLKDELLTYDFSKVYSKNFSLRLHDIKLNGIIITEKEYANYIWQNLEKNNLLPHVDLKNSQTSFELLKIKTKLFFTVKIFEHSEKYDSRRAHLLPKLSPTAMNPKIARALINILGPKKSFLDPMCGTGGILIEGIMLGYTVTGYDIDTSQLSKAKTNFEHLKLDKNSYKLIHKNYETIPTKNFKNIVTDLPYGKSSKKSAAINTLYAEFVAKLQGDAVIIMPSFVNYKKILKENLQKNLEIKTIIPHYVHKSLTREIIVIRERK